MERIKDKIKEIESYLLELEEIMPKNFEDYKHIKTKAACERYFEKIIEGITDLTFLIIKDGRLEIPSDDKGAFDILSKEKIISEKLANKLKEAKGMRNILAHKYGETDDEIVFHSITEEIQKDANEFIKEIKKMMSTNKV